MVCGGFPWIVKRERGFVDVPKSPQETDGPQ